MKKKLLLIPVLFVVFILCATPVLAGDPPDTEIDVTVVTLGDVDLDVDINAGGDVDVTVDGIDLSSLAFQASQGSQAYSQINQPTNHLWDYTYYWWLSGIGERVEGQINDLTGVMGLLMDAEAKLIEGQELTRGDITSINTALSTLEVSAASRDATTSGAIGDLQVRDDEIWNQLMYGAEAHIAILENKAVIQDGEIASLQSEIEAMSARQETAYANYTVLLNYTDLRQEQYLYYFWILGGGSVILLIGLVFVGIYAKRKRF